MTERQQTAEQEALTAAGGQEAALPEEPRALATRLRVSFYRHAIARLEAEAEAGLAARPDDPAALAYLARARYKEGRFEEARAALARLGRASVEGLLAHADYHDYVGEWCSAIADFEAVLALEPEHVDALVGLAGVHLARNDLARADRLAERAAPLVGADDPCQWARLRVLQGGVAGLKANTGGLFDKLRWGPGVQHAFESARDACPDSPYPRFALGRFYREAPGALGGSLAAARESFERAIALDPWYHPAYVACIGVLEAMGQDAEAARQRADYRERFAALPGAIAALEEG